MKKILALIGLLLLCAPIFATATLYEYFEFEQNGVGAMGNFTLDPVNNQTYTTNCKYGTYALTIASYNNTFKYATNMMDWYAAQSSHTTQAWIYVPDTGGNVWVMAWSNNWTEYSWSCRRDDQRIFCWYDGAEQSYNVGAAMTKPGWHLISGEWSGTQYKCYVDGTLYVTFNDTDNAFTGWTTFVYLLMGIYGDTWSSGVAFDRLMIASGLAGGVEIEPVVETPTFTATATFTATPTFTATETATPTFTVTKSHTLTGTQTITKTHTDTFTVTPTATITPSVTMTVTKTVTPTYTVTASITPTVTPTLTVTKTVTPTMTRTPTYTISPTFVVYCNAAWAAITPVDCWSVRDKARSVSVGAEVWIIGGGLQDGVQYNDSYSSSNGADWTTLSKNCEYIARQEHIALYYDSKLWVISGFNGIDADVYLKDAWYSTDGIAWSCATRNAAFGGRRQAMGVVYNNKMWVISGGNSFLSGYGNYNDAWYSTDGVTWSAATRNAAFTKRILAGITVWKNKMWLIGGEYAETGTWYNDVWYSTDGAIWTRATQHAGFNPAANIYAWINDNLLYVYIDATNEIWNSKDGVKWKKLSASGSSPSLRGTTTNLFFADFMFTFGGYDVDHDVNDTWKADVNKCLQFMIYDDETRQPWEW